MSKDLICPLADVRANRLCEVNRDPSLKCDSDLDLKLKTSMLADLLR